jgi:F-type H+-transporting ATPase subunit b
MTLIDKITTAVSEAIEAALGVSLLDMFVQLAATVILVIIVKKYFWSKITLFLEKRRELVQSELTTAQAAAAEATANKEKTESEYTKLRKSARDVLESARLQGEEERSEIIHSAKSEAKKIAEDSKKSTALDIEKAKAEVNNQAVELAVLMAAKILEKEIDSSKYADLSIASVSEKSH